MRLTLSLAALAAVLTTATPALAVVTDTATAEARGLVLQPLTLTWASDLDFGTVIGSTAAGSVTIDADDGTRTKGGGVTLVTSAAGGRATFGGAGSVGQVVLLTMNAPTQLVSATNGADKLTVNKMYFDKDGATRTIDNTQAFLVGVGGKFDIAANQPNGLYRAQFDVTASYQ